MSFVIGMLSFLVVTLIGYIFYLKTQLRDVNNQLVRRLHKPSNQPIQVQFINSELNRLISNINDCLKAEESLRLESFREEKRFKELIANISHDLRTPLTSIKGYLQLLNGSELSEQQQLKLEVCIKHAKELEELIEHFFEYSYLLNTEPNLHMERINLTNLITECLADSVANFEKHQMTVILKETPTLFGFGDKDNLIRIVRNLIQNSIQYSAGDVEVELIQTEQAVITFKNQVKSDVEIDTVKLFDRFYTGDRARNHSTGLGLSIVRILAEQMNGSANAEFVEGELIIYIKIPLYL